MADETLRRLDEEHHSLLQEGVRFAATLPAPITP